MPSVIYDPILRMKRSGVATELVGDHNMGWYLDAVALRAAHPTAQAGDFATVGGDTNGPTIWVWDQYILDWEDTASSALVKSIFGRNDVVVADAGDYAAFLDATNTIYVESVRGDDTNDGLSITQPKKTIVAALLATQAFNPIPLVSRAIVKVLDSAIYTENVIIPGATTLDMSSACLSGTITLGNYSRFFAIRHTPSANSQDMVTNLATASSLYQACMCNSTGYSGIMHFVNSVVGAIMSCHMERFIVGDGNQITNAAAGSVGVNFATDGTKFSSDKTINYGYASNLVYGNAGYAQWYLDVVGTPVAITYAAGSAYTATTYKLKAMATSGSRMPRDWTLHGKLGGGSFVLLDTQSSIVWAANEEKEFTIGTPGSYDTYKVTVSATSHATRMEIADIGFWAGVEGIGGTIHSFSDLTQIGASTVGYQCEDVNAKFLIRSQRTICAGSLIVQSAGEVDFAGQFVDATLLYIVTGGILSWDVARIGTTYDNNVSGTPTRSRVQLISGWVYLVGNESTDGSWRTGNSGTDLVFQRRESGTWVTKSSVSA